MMQGKFIGRCLGFAAATILFAPATAGADGAVLGAGSAPVRHIATFYDTPITLDGGYLLVPAEFGDVRSRLVLDTAANTMVISPALQARLGLTDAQDVEVLGAGGAARTQAVEVTRLRVADLERTKVGAVVVDLSRFRRGEGEPYGGILGNDFLRAYDVEVNMPASRLRVYEPGPSPRVHAFKEQYAVKNLAADPGWIVLEVQVNGRPVKAIVDTGASSSVLNWTAAGQAGVTRETPGLLRRKRPTSGLGAAAAETHAFQFDDIRVGSARFDVGPVRIADLRVFEALGLKDEPAMLFGLDMLRETRCWSATAPDGSISTPPPISQSGAAR